MDIGKRINYYRTKLNMTQEELALKLGYKGRASINKIEMGKADIPLSKIDDMARALHLSPEELLGYVTEDDRDFIVDLNANNGLIPVGSRYQDFKDIADLMDDETYAKWIEIGKVMAGK